MTITTALDTAIESERLARTPMHTLTFRMSRGAIAALTAAHRDMTIAAKSGAQMAYCDIPIKEDPMLDGCDWRLVSAQDRA